jgi:hypothetical protein
MINTEAMDPVSYQWGKHESNQEVVLNSSGKYQLTEHHVASPVGLPPPICGISQSMPRHHVMRKTTTIKLMLKDGEGVGL